MGKVRLVAALLVALAPAVRADPSTEGAHKAPLVDLVSLQTMHDRNVVTDAEYDAAVGELAQSIGRDNAMESLNLVLARWSASLYGFVESDFLFDSTQSFNDVAGNTLVQRPVGAPQAAGTLVSQYAGSTPRLQFSVRNTRFGLRLRAPEVRQVRASATLEMDFLGYDPAPTANTEAAFFNNPTLRIRHAYLKVETPIVDVLVGQYWHMFGWQGAFFPNSVEIQGLPGELYERTAQLRLSKKLATKDITFEVAAAALRPPTRDGYIPEVAGGVRVTAERWRGVQTQGATGTTFAPASLAITGDFRDFKLPVFSQFPTSTIGIATGALAIDAFIPVLPAMNKKRDNSLSLNGEFVYGGGISDMYTSLTGGITQPSIVNNSPINPAPPYPGNVDNGMVIFDNCGGGSMQPYPGCQHGLHTIVWTTALVGLQYYLPGGFLWVSGNYAHIESPNIGDFTTNQAPNPNNSTYADQATVRKSEDWFDANVFFEPLRSVRVGLEYAAFIDHYVDGIQATNHRVQLSGFFVF